MYLLLTYRCRSRIIALKARNSSLQSARVRKEMLASRARTPRARTKCQLSFRGGRGRPGISRDFTIANFGNCNRDVKGTRHLSVPAVRYPCARARRESDDSFDLHANTDDERVNINHTARPGTRDRLTVAGGGGTGERQARGEGRERETP